MGDTGARSDMLDDMQPVMVSLLKERAVLQNRFQIVDVLDMGGFATVFRCTDLKDTTGCKEVVAKVVVDLVSDDEGRLTDAQARTYKPTMKHEHAIYKSLKGNTYSKPCGIPATWCSGTKKVMQGPKQFCLLSYLVMQLLGPPAGRLSLDTQAYMHSTALLVSHGLAMLRCLRRLHQCGIVHRDVKPDNFCLPQGYDIQRPVPVDAVYIVDMGMAMQWKHKDFSWEDQTYAFWGTVDYASVRNLSGYHPTPRDDLEGLACTLLEMATGEPPFDLLHNGESGKPLQQHQLLRAASQKEKEWCQKLADASTPEFIKRWVRQLRSLPPQHELTEADYTTLASILRGALVADDTATSAWSSAISLERYVSTKRPAIEASRAGSNMHSTCSESATAATACVAQSRQLKQQKLDDDHEEFSIACGLLIASPDE